MRIKLNCDMGEGLGIWKMGNDEKIMPFIDMANLACGFHAGDVNIMTKSVLLAKEHNVTIGAHPSYDDLKGFGRRSIPHTYDEIKALVLYQLGALDAIAKSNNMKVSYLKPHGALYNDMMKDELIYKAILDAISSYNKDIKLMILSTNNNEQKKSLASLYGIDLLFEVFADRNYTSDGILVNRNEKNAVLHDIDEVKKRIQVLKDESYLLSIDNKKLYLDVDTICVHGDNDNALEFVKEIRNILD